MARHAREEDAAAHDADVLAGRPRYSSGDFWRRGCSGSNGSITRVRDWDRTETESPVVTRRDAVEGRRHELANCAVFWRMNQDQVVRTVGQGRTENPGVGGSIPSLPTRSFKSLRTSRIVESGRLCAAALV